MFAPEIAPRLKNTAVRAGQQDACWTAHFEEHISTEAFSTNFAYVSIDLLTAHTNNRGRNAKCCQILINEQLQPHQYLYSLVANMSS